jgi:hypothetical protein
LGAFQPELRGSLNAFVTKLTGTGSDVVYSTYLGGNYDFGTSVTVDASGSAYVTGYTGSTEFPVTPGAFQPTYLGGVGGLNAFLTRLSAGGADLVYSTFLGGSVLDAGNAVAADSTGRAYVAGYAASADFPTTPAAFQSAHGGGVDGFVSVIATGP